MSDDTKVEVLDLKQHVPEPVPPEDPGDGATVLNLAEARKRKLEREDTTEGEKYLNRLRRAQHMLSAVVRKAGRLRIARADLEAVALESRFGVKVQENGDLVLTWLG